MIKENIYLLSSYYSFYFIDKAVKTEGFGVFFKASM